MPVYYDVAASSTTSGTAGTQATGCALKLLTGTAVAASVRGCYAAARGGTAGGGILRAIAAATAQSSSGTTTALNKRNPNAPTATTSCMVATTDSVSTIERFAVGFAQTGGMGGWVAIEPDAAIYLLSGGSTNGNLEFSPIANASSVTYDLTVELAEI